MAAHSNADSASIRSEGPGRGTPPKYNELSEEEKLILKGCSSASFWSSCLPLTAGLTISTYYGLKTGFLKAKNPRIGALYYAGATGTGLLLGKFLYYPICHRRLLDQCPNGVIATYNREHKQWREDVKAGRVTPPPIRTVREQRRQTSEQTGPSHGADTETQPAVAAGQFSYSEARRRNRTPGQYQSSDVYAGAPMPPPPATGQPHPPTQQPQPRFFADEPRYPNPPAEDQQQSSARLKSGGRKNEYGDEWAE